MRYPSVQIRAIDGYQLPVIEEAVREWFDALSQPKFKRSKRVLIKPNLLGAYHPDRAVTTHPVVLEAIIRYFLAHHQEVWLGDSPGGTVPVSTVWERCGLQDLADRYPIKLVNLSTSGFRELKSDGISIKISELLFQCGIVINVGKYKTHSLMAFTGALKNLYGLIPGMVKSEYHRLYPDTQSFANLLVALYKLCQSKITYSIIDGIVGMDKAGPSAGNPRAFGLLMGSESIPALDTVAARMMGFALSDVPYLWGALHHDGILPSRIVVPHSFAHYRIPDAEIKVVKMRTQTLQYIPRPLRFVFRKLYYGYPVISNRCIKCGICVASCPVKAINWQEDGFPKIDKNACIRCMCCHELCSQQAIDIHRSFVASRFM